MDEITQEQLDFLATKCMGWEWREEVKGKHCKGWGTYGHKSAGWYDEHGKLKAQNWQPDRNWPQYGRVIEKMRELGWDCRIHDDGTVVGVTYWRAGVGGFTALESDERHARMLAAARAMEATDG